MFELIFVLTDLLSILRTDPIVDSLYDNCDQLSHIYFDE